MRTPALLLLVLTIAARAASATSTLELEQAARRVAEDRDRLTGERRRLQAEAAILADGISALKTAAAGARAGRELAGRLRDFERVATRLDGVERALADREGRLFRARAAFAAAADVEERALEERARAAGVAAVAEAISQLAAARRRVAALEPAAGFRPPLDVSLEPLDGPPELEAKLVLIDGERARVAERRGELEREEALLTARIAAKREWVRELGTARRDAAGRVELLDRGYEQAQSALTELATRADALRREKAALDEADAGLAERRREAEDRRRALTKGHEGK